jgi:hypothetical protein
MELFNRRPSAFVARVPQRPELGRPGRPGFEHPGFAPGRPFEGSRFVNREREPWHHRIARAFGIEPGQPAQPYNASYQGTPSAPLGQLPQGPLPPNVDGHRVSHDAHRIFELEKAHDPRAAQAMRILHKLVLGGDQAAKATLDLVLRMHATVTGAFDIAGAFRPAPPQGRGRPAAPGRGGYRPAAPGRRPAPPMGRRLAPAAPRQPWGPVLQPQPWGVPVFGPGGSATYMDPGSLDAMEAASTPLVIPSTDDATLATDTAQTADASQALVPAADGSGAYFRPFHSLARKNPTWYHPGMNVGDASGAHGWSGGRRAGYPGWAGAGRGWGLYGGAWPGAYVPVWNPAIVDPQTWAAEGQIALPPGATDASGASGDYIDRQDYDGLWPYKMSATALAGAPICAPGDMHGPIWNYGLGGQLGGLWPYRSCATAVAGASPAAGSQMPGISGVVTARDLTDAIARIEHAAAVINNDVNVRPPTIPGAADAWRTYVTALFGRLANLRQANKDVFSAGALADLLVTEAAGLNAARQLLASQGAALTVMPPLVLPFAGPSASSGVWHWATFGITLGGLVALDKITRGIRHRYAQQAQAAKAATVKAPGAVTGLWSWPTMWWTLGGTTLLDVLTRDKVWARSKLAQAASVAHNATGGPSNLLIIASPPPPPPPPQATTPSPAVPVQDASGAWWTIPAAALAGYGAYRGYQAYRQQH